MCGIAGIASNTMSAEYILEHTKKICDGLIHRGPDDEGFAGYRHACIGMRRLSIIDLSTGHQPFYDRTAQIAVVGNGEIYNYKELYKIAEQENELITSTSDIAIIPFLYKKYGLDFVKLLRGMFAVAIWDNSKQELHLIRDRLGKKPLFYALMQDGGLVFGSELNALVTTGLFKTEIDYTAVDKYMLFSRVPQESCIYKNVYKVPAANILSWSKNGIVTRKYWELSFKEKFSYNEQTLIETTESVLKESVRLRLQSDVPLGAFLSGGVDSSLVVGMMRTYFNVPVQTFSIGYDEKNYSELKYAERVARHLQTDHHEYIIKSDTPEIWGELCSKFSEPFGDTSFLPTYYVSKLAKQFVTVVLTGDAGDENFGGYEWYKGMELVYRLNSMPVFAKKALVTSLSKVPHHQLPFVKKFSGRINKIIGALNETHKNETAVLQALFGSSVSEVEGVLNSKKNGLMGLEESVLNSRQKILDQYDGDNLVEKVMYGQLMTLLNETFFVKVDMMSMANSIEARSPFADHVLTEHVAKIPFSFKIRNGETKYILKKIAEKYIPNDVIYRKKMGFGIPLQDWIKGGKYGDYVGDILHSKHFLENEYYNHAMIFKLYSEHKSGKANHWNILSKIVCLELWLKSH
jgi:asparagine synthase (glutamine-hydrolysing)